MNSWYKNLEQYILELLRKISPHVKSTVILGLSGGPDSVFLFHLLKDLHNQSHIHLIAAHLNHEWRTTADKDETFCKNLCTLYNIPFISRSASTLEISIKPNGSREEIGRKLRRFFLEETMKKYSAEVIALAHHFNDQQETFFMRLIRGTSLSGLHGMNEIDLPYIRPLLHIKKQVMLNDLHERNFEYVIDHTNESDDYLRNRIRKYVIPAFQSCDGRFDTNFHSTIEKLKREDEFFNELTAQAFEKIFSAHYDGNLIGSLSLFKHQHPVLQRRIILSWLITERVSFTISSGFIDEIIKFLSSERGGTHKITPHVMICKKQDSFFVFTSKHYDS